MNFRQSQRQLGLCFGNHALGRRCKSVTSVAVYRHPYYNRPAKVCKRTPDDPAEVITPAAKRNMAVELTLLQDRVASFCQYFSVDCEYDA